MTKSYYIDKFEQLIEIGTTFGYNWFRGHSKVIGDLVPSVFRGDFINSIRDVVSPDYEMRIASEFIRRAPSFSDNLPEQGNYIEWLFLMQHHGAPTRLLDWSANILAATYFAVTANNDEDAEIWSMLPWKLNESCYGFHGLPILEHSPQVKFLAHEIFSTFSVTLLEKYKLKEVPEKPFALQPPLKHPRYTAQQSCFTIHPKPNDGNSIQDMLTSEDYLVRYIIPKGLKKKFETKLRYLGISNFSLFPDLEGLAKTIIKEEETILWSQPAPLKYKEYSKENL